MDLKARALAAVILGASFTVSAGINTWTAAGPDGGEVRKIVYHQDAPTTLYMIAGAGFLRSVDDGATWQLTKKEFLNGPSDLEVDPTDPDRVYVVSSNHRTFEVSTNGGVTFAPLTSFPSVGNVFQLEVSADGNTIYANAGLRVFRSEDRGATWHERTAIGGTGAGANRLLIHPTDRNTLYATAPVSSTTSGLFVTHDGAATWQLLAAASAAGYINDIAIPDSNPSRIWLAGDNGIYVSSNAGVNFSLNQSPNLPAGISGVLTLGINPGDATNVYIGGQYGRVFRTNDDGATWLDVTGNLTSSYARTFAIRPTQSTPHVFVGGFGGLSLSTVGGTNWVQRDTGFAGTNVVSLSANPSADRIYIGAAARGAHYLEGGSTTSKPVNNEQLRALAQVPATYYVTDVLAQDGAPGRLFASLDHAIARSLDGGSTWSLTNFPVPPAHQVRRLASSPGDPEVILAGMLSSVYRSADGGQNWAPATTGLPSGAYATVIAFAPSDPLVAYAAPEVPGSPVPQKFGIYRSTNAGQSWSPANTGIEAAAVVALAVDPSNAQVAYVSADQKLWKSTNGGSSWVELAAWQGLLWGTARALAVDPTDPRILYATGNNAVARSIDRGESWEILRGPQASSLWFSEAILPDPRRPHVVLVGTLNLGAQQITIAPDLALESDASPSVLPVGAAQTYQYTVDNLGPYHGTGVKVTLQLPASMQDVNVTPSAGSCTAPGTVITCTLDVVRAGSNAYVSLNFTPTTAGAFQIAATVASDQADAVATNNALTHDITVAAPADVSITMTGPASSQTGNSVSYTLTASNGGPGSATDVRVSYETATGIMPGTVNTTVGTCGVNVRIVTCNLGNLAAAASATITVNATADATGTQTSTATITTTAADTAAANNTATVSTNVTAPPASGVQPPASNSGGGGGALSVHWLVFMLLMLAMRSLAARPAYVGVPE